MECGLCTCPMVLVMDLFVDQSAFFAALIMGRNMMLITACWFSEHTTSQEAEKNIQPQALHIYARISDQLPSQAFCQYNSSKKREVGPQTPKLMNPTTSPSCSSFSAKHRSICIQTLVKLSHVSHRSKKMKYNEILNVYVTSTTVT